MNIEKEISSAAIAAVKELYGQDVPEKMVQLQKTKPNFEGNITLVVFPFLKISHKKPQDTANEIGEVLVRDCKAVAAYNAVGGFLNLVIASEAWLNMLKDIDADPHFGEKPVTKDSPLYMVEYSSPNTNKPLHLGHVRNNLLGWSLSKILEANGKKVIKTNIVNDRGIHIMKSMLAWLKWGNGCTPESTGKKGDHLIGDFYVLFDKHYKQECEELKKQYIAEGMKEDEAEEKAKNEAPLIKEAHQMLVKWEAGDKEIRDLWAKMNSWVYAGFDVTYKALGVSFDKIYYESNTYLEGKRKVMEGLKKGLFYQKEDGSIWADLTKEGLDQKLLIRSDGTTVYMTQDIGTAEMRFNDYPIDKMIYVVGNEQNYHFQVLSIILDRLGFKWGKDLVHFSYGMVELPNGKMKSREGTVVDADDLIAEMIADARKTSEEHGQSKDFSEAEKQEIARIVGLGALKYFILKVDARKNMLFNPAESIDFNGNTGPFIQYTYARIQSILRKSESPSKSPSPALPVRGGGSTTIASSSNDPASPSPNGEGRGEATSPAGEGMGEAPYSPNEKEVELIQKLDGFKDAVADAGQNYNPAGIANYCYELTKLFNQFYHDYSILSADTEAEKSFRLMLAKNVGKVIKNGMALLGIEVPERM